MKPFKITAQDVRYSSTLERSDIGRWAVIINGAFCFVSGPDFIPL